MTIFRRLAFAVLWYLAQGAAFCAFASAPITSESRHELAVRFDPADGALTAQGTLGVTSLDPVDRLELLLNGGLEIQRFQPDRAAAVVIEHGIVLDSYALPNTRHITVTPEHPLAPGERMTIAFDYSGTVTTDSIEIGRGVVTPGWSEMSMETLWYPVWLQGPELRSDVTLTLPEGYRVAAPGTVEALPDGRWRLRPQGPVNGRITFIAFADAAERRRMLGEGLQGVVLSIAPEPRADAILEAAAVAFDAYRTLFGPPDADVDTLTIVYANRDIGLKYPRQAYATGGDFIVLDESDARVQMDTLHHEVAHLWWSSGTPRTPDEFMSESISEFLAVRHGGDVWGDAWLADRRAAMARRSAATEDSLRDIDGFSGSRQTLLYNRGPLALFALQERVGRAAIDGLLRDVATAQIVTLDGFVERLAARHDRGIADTFRAAL